jgi:hypothetical protein
MRVKKGCLNDETLCKYGFKKIGDFDGLVEWWKESDYSAIFIHSSGKLSIFIKRPFTNVFIDDVVYKLIADAMVEEG